MTGTRVVVVGLGPAGADLLLPAARDAVSGAAVRFVRTARHPAVDDLVAEGLEVTALDRHYEQAPTLEDAYTRIVAEVAAAARDHAGRGGVVYAVPGNPAVGERTVAMLRLAVDEVELVPGLSFAELAWARLGIDLIDGGRVLDARALTRDQLLHGGPVLLAQCDSRAVLSRAKLVLLEELDPEHEVVVLQRLGLSDERVVSVPLAELDREVAVDHLAAVFVDLGDAAAVEYARFQALIERLRGPDGCPWDAEQTHHSLARHLIEETYEVIEAIERLPADAPVSDGAVPEESYALLEEELGDLAVQVVFHATLARETGAFTMREVLRGIREKLVRRHPHVFGDVEVDGAEHVMRNWEQIKREERRAAGVSGPGHGSDELDRSESGTPPSIVDGIPEHLPALLAAHKLFRKGASVGLELMSPEEAAAAVTQSLDRLASATGDDARQIAGDTLAVLALLCRQLGFDAEGALRAWVRRFRRRVLTFEALARDRGLDLEALEPEGVTALWIEAGSGPGRPPDRS